MLILADYRMGLTGQHLVDQGSPVVEGNHEEHYDTYAIEGYQSYLKDVHLLDG